MTTGQILLLAGCGVLAAGAAAAAVIFFKKYNAAKSNETNVSRETVAEFAASANAFTGLYEPLWRIKSRQLKLFQNVLADLDVRINNLSGAPALQQYWRELSAGFEAWDETEAAQKAAAFLAFAGEAGLTRDADTEVKVDREVLRRYTVQSGAPAEIGAAARVEIPCWTLGDEVLEKGVIAIHIDTNKGGNANE